MNLQAQIQSLQAQIAQLQAAVAGAGQSSGGVQTYPTSLIIPFDYVYTAVLTANGSSSGVLQLASDSTFELMRILVLTSADVPTNYWNNNFTVQATDQSTGRQLSNSPVQQCNFATNAYQYGNDEKYPILFPAQGIIQFAIVNLLNTALTVNLTLKGYKIFQTSPK